MLNPLHFLSHPTDVTWLFQTHLRDNLFVDRNKVYSFAIHGNEDCPWRIDLYDSQKTTRETRAIHLTYVPQNDSYQITDNPPRNYRQYCEINGWEIRSFEDWKRIYSRKTH